MSLRDFEWPRFPNGDQTVKIRVCLLFDKLLLHTNSPDIESIHEGCPLNMISSLHIVDTSKYIRIYHYIHEFTQTVIGWVRPW